MTENTIMIKDRVRIVADSSSDVLALENMNFANAPLKIITSEKEYVDNAELNVEGMVEDLLKYNGKSSTSCPNPQDWLSVFGDADYVFCVTITSNLSGSYNAACLAKNIYEQENKGKRVYVVNSYSTGPEMRLIIEKLCELVDEGNTFDDACKKIEEYMKKTGLLFVLQSMKNLANNGRVSHLAAKMAGILGIRAIGKASDIGTLEMLEKARGEKGAVDSLIKHLKELGYKGGRVRIAHCLNVGFANAVKEKILADFEKAHIEICECRGLCSFYAEKGGLLMGFEK